MAETEINQTKTNNHLESQQHTSPISTGTAAVPVGPKTEIKEFLKGKIWTKMYYVRYAGATLSAKTTIIKLDDGKLLIHSPGTPLDEDFKAEITKIGGDVGYLIAPGDFHHLNVPEWQVVYPNAKTYICPGVDTKRRDLKYDGILKDEPEPEWKDEIKQLIIRGRIMSEVVFFHVPSATLIATDIIQFITDDSMKKDGTDQSWGRWFWLTTMRMKNRVLMAPHYRTAGFPDKLAVKARLEHVINEWKPWQVIVNHGENLTQKPEAIKAILLVSWSAVLGRAPLMGPIQQQTPAAPVAAAPHVTPMPVAQEAVPDPKPES